MENFKEIGEFIRIKIIGCKFVGISSDNEVFVEFDHDDSELEHAAVQRIRKEFPYVSKVVVVVKPSIKQVQGMVDDLNQFLEKGESKKKNILDIGRF